MGNETPDQGKSEAANTVMRAKPEPDAAGKSSGDEVSPTPSPRDSGKGNVAFVIALIVVLFALLVFTAVTVWSFRIALLPLVLGMMFLVVDVLVFLAKPRTVRIGNEERPRVFSTDLRLIAFGASLGLAIIGVKWVGDALSLKVDDGAWENWHWASRLLCAVLFTGLVAVGIERLTKGE